MSWFSKLKKTGDILQNAVSRLQAGLGFVDENTIDEMEEMLILADMGTATTDRIIAKLRQKIKQKAIPVKCRLVNVSGSL